MKEREKLLEEAKAAVSGDRDIQYGNPIDNYETAAALWNAYMDRKKARHPERVFAFEPEDVNVMMILIKVSRLAWTPKNKDSWLDIAGYAACGWDCVANDPLNKATFVAKVDKYNQSIAKAHTEHSIFSIEYMEDKIYVQYTDGCDYTKTVEELFPAGYSSFDDGFFARLVRNDLGLGEFSSHYDRIEDWIHRVRPRD